jgi:DNA-binding NarL/FixJ family response regulator
MRPWALWGHTELLSLLTEHHDLLKRIADAMEAANQREDSADRPLYLEWNRLPGARRPGRRLAPRLEQTLAHLLDGDSEKQVAYKLKLSPHTVHVYVKTLYKRFNANSRAELMAKFTLRRAIALTERVAV